MKFEDAVEHILRLEGGYINHPSDPGGETKFGISKRAYPHLSIKELSIADATEIYRRDYWDKIGIAKLPGYIRLLVFDSAVNQGPQSAVMLLQEALGVPRDGVIGPATISTAALSPPLRLLGNYVKNRSRRYHAVHTFKTFGLGWMKRLMDVTIESITAMET